MPIIFFYVSLAVLLIAFLLISLKRKPTLPALLIGITTVGYSMLNDSLFGEFSKLFHYINPSISVLYIMLSAVFIYPFLNMLYVMFLPQNGKKAFLYTVVWIVGMCVFEYASVVTKTIVFTGWKPVPWSLVVYIIAYLWIYFFYRYLSKRFKRA